MSSISIMTLEGFFKARVGRRRAGREGDEEKKKRKKGVKICRWRCGVGARRGSGG